MRIRFASFLRLKVGAILIRMSAGVKRFAFRMLRFCEGRGEPVAATQRGRDAPFGNFCPRSQDEQ